MPPPAARSRTVARVAAALIAAYVLASTPAGANGPTRALRYLMGTWCELTVFDARPDAAAIESAFREIGRLEKILSNWDAGSELSALNANAGRGLEPVSPDLAAVVGAAEDLCAASGGAFDPSVGAAVHAWGFDTDTPGEPSHERERAAAERVGCDRVKVSADPPSIALADRTRLDLGGIGKGYAVDRALAVLGAHGITRAKLDFGSSSLGFLGGADGGWPVVVADPRDRDRPLLSLRVDSGSVSSSGQRERSFVRDGHLYGHIFDPRTAMPLESPLLLVTVVAPNATLADGLSTALFVMGPDRGRALVSRMPGGGAVFFESRRGGDLKITTVGSIGGVTRLSR